MSDDPKKVPPVAPGGMVAAAGQIGVARSDTLSGAGMVAAAGQIGAAVTIGLSGAGAFAAAGEIVVSIRELPQAIQENKSPILLRLPQLLPAFIVVYVLTQIAHSDGILRHLALSFAGLGFLALLRGYNVDASFTVSDSGKVISALKLTKKNQDEDKK
jgi:hypothetical protein